MDLLTESQIRLINDFRDRVKRTEQKKRNSHHNEKSFNTSICSEDHSDIKPKRLLLDDSIKTKNSTVISPEPHRNLHPIVFNATPNEKEDVRSSYYKQKGDGQYKTQSSHSARIAKSAQNMSQGAYYSTSELSEYSSLQKKSSGQTLESSNRSGSARSSTIRQPTFGVQTDSNDYRETFSKRGKPPTSLKCNEPTRRIDYHSLSRTELSTDSYHSHPTKLTKPSTQESPLGPRLKVPRVQTPVEMYASQRYQREGFEFYPQTYSSQERPSIERKSFSSIVDKANEASRFSSQRDSHVKSYENERPERGSVRSKELPFQRNSKRKASFLDQPEYDDRDVETIPTSRPISPSVLRETGPTHEKKQGQIMKSNSRKSLGCDGKENQGNRLKVGKENIYNPNLKHPSILRLDLAKRIKKKELDLNKLLDLLEEHMVESDSFCDKIRSFLDLETYAKGFIPIERN